MSVINLSEDQVKELLDWPTIFDAVEQSLRSVCEVRTSNDQPSANQPARTRTLTENGVLLAMPGFISNYKLSTIDTSKTFNSLGCKLVTAFWKNDQLKPPKPNILGNIFLFHENTGELKAILQASEITAWRTAAASLVATKYLYSNRPSRPPINTLGIVGCGIQGRIHAIGFASTSFINTIHLWNQTKSRAEALAAELISMRQTFKNPNMNIVCVDSVEQCAKDADVIVTATSSSSAVLARSMVKNDVHINAVGAGRNHHSEINEDIYMDEATKIYVDYNASARSELSTLNAPIVGEVGDIINGHSQPPSGAITIFHSMGMAVEDVAVGQALIEKFQKKK